MRCLSRSISCSLALLTAGLAQSEPAPLPMDTIALAFSKITINDGLSQGMVSTIAQDPHGFMWFGTKDGLNRYDGYRFTVFRHDAADTNSVRESTITVCTATAMADYGWARPPGSTSSMSAPSTSST